MLLLAATTLVLAPVPDVAALRARGQAYLDDLHAKGSFPGGSAALVLPGGETLTFTVGVASRETGEKLGDGARLLAGSIGKTYVTAAAHHLAGAGELDLDAKAASFFEGEEWFLRLPNAKDFTVRQLLRHQSGLPRYVFEPAFWKLAIAEKDKVWKPEELLSYVFDAEPLFAAGEGWSYSDTNYIVVGMILEKVSGRRFYEYVRKELLEPHALTDTVPSDSRRIPKLAQGHVVMARRFGLPARFLEDGVCVVNPQFEWCGGGFAATPLDLARWARILYSGRAFEGNYLDDLLDAVPAAELGPGVRYGLGVMVRETELGPLLGHDGFMPGYMSSMGWFPDLEIAAAFQVNTDDATAIPVRPYRVLVDLAVIAEDALR